METIKVCQFSDWHGRSQRLPPADLYVCTGDIIPNTRACYWVDKAPEQYAQKKWIAAHVDEYSRLPASNAPLLVVRGNHDYVDLLPLFDKWPGTVTEFSEPRSIEMFGLRFGGFRGVPPINGDWADELSEAELAHQCKALGPVDVLITHAPARGFRDLCPGGNVGSTSIRNYIEQHGPRVHLFGHIHESAGQHVQDGTTYSNAALGVEEIILE